MKNLSMALVLLVMTIVIFFLLHISNPSNFSESIQTKSDIKESVLECETCYYDRQGVLLRNDVVSSSLGLIKQKSNDGKIELSIDGELQSFVYQALGQIADDKSYRGGAGVIMDVNNGQLIALVSYSSDTEEENLFYRAYQGLYAPGSTIKPFLALAALSEGVIDSNKEILSTGSIELPNMRYPEKPYVYRDWKAHGLVDMRRAIGVSSNIYFYAIGGGYEDQEGLGIGRIEEYLRMFGFGEKTGIKQVEEFSGRLPSYNRKSGLNGNEDWRLGDTYLVSIGQNDYGVTSLQLTRAVSAIASQGKLVSPTLLLSDSTENSFSQVPVKQEYFKVVQEGMEYAVLNGTAAGLYIDGITIAAKTGTTEVDDNKELIHSWVSGYFPHDNPQYAFTFMLDSGPWGEEVGAVAVADDVMAWIRDNRTQYLSEN